MFDWKHETVINRLTLKKQYTLRSLARQWLFLDSTLYFMTATTWFRLLKIGILIELMTNKWKLIKS